MSMSVLNPTLKVSGNFDTQYGTEPFFINQPSITFLPKDYPSL